MKIDLSTILPLLVLLAQGFGTLAGIASIIAPIVSLLKSFGVITDGNSNNWVAGMNAVAFIVVAAIIILMPNMTIQSIDAVALSIGVVLSFLVSLVIQMRISQATYYGLKGVPALHKRLAFSFKKASATK